MNFEIIPNEQTPKILHDLSLDYVQVYITEHREELDAFLEFAKTQHKAVGLAANQCSLDGKRFMVRAFALRNLFTHDWSLVIDPVITENVGICEERAEGCLTWEGKKILAERYRGVIVDYATRDGEVVRGELHKGFEGQIWQHEINHLNGIEEVVVEKHHPDPKETIVGRNEPCPCGSGKKYKKCCLTLLQ